MSWAMKVLANESLGKSVGEASNGANQSSGSGNATKFNQTANAIGSNQFGTPGLGGSTHPAETR